MMYPFGSGSGVAAKTSGLKLKLMPSNSDIILFNDFILTDSSELNLDLNANLKLLTEEHFIAHKYVLMNF